MLEWKGTYSIWSLKIHLVSGLLGVPGMIRNLPRRSFKLNWLFQLETVCLTSKFRPLFRHSVEELTRAFSVPRIRSPGMFPKSLGQLRTVSVFHWQFLITYIFSVSLKFGSMLHHGSMGRVQSKECYFMFTYTFSVFFIKKCDFIRGIERMASSSLEQFLKSPLFRLPLVAKIWLGTWLYECHDHFFIIIKWQLSFVCLVGCLFACFSHKQSTKVIYKKLQHNNEIKIYQLYTII